MNQMTQFDEAQVSEYQITGIHYLASTGKKPLKVSQFGQSTQPFLTWVFSVFRGKTKGIRWLSLDWISPKRLLQLRWVKIVSSDAQPRLLDEALVEIDDIIKPLDQY